MVCLICGEHPEKYKCPSCLLPYCSTGCWKKHKEGDPCKPPEKLSSDKAIAETPKPYQYPTLNTVEKNKLSQLAHSDELKSVLSNPHLRTMLTSINSSPDPAALIKAAMLEPIFTEFADIALKTIDG